MPRAQAAFLLLQTDIMDMVSRSTPLTDAILVLLLIFSVYSWTIIFAKRSAFKAAATGDKGFLRAFRKLATLDGATAVAEQFKPAPLVQVFEEGLKEVERQARGRGRLNNKEAIGRVLQIATSEQLAALENKLGWLATTASVSPFIGLLGTVIGIIRAFQNLGTAGSTSLRAVGPGISEALIATAVGLFAAIPAAMFYNHFGHSLREAGSRMDDFALEFQNLAERQYGE